jgi:ferritin
MSISCIIKEKVEKMKSIFKSISDKNQLEILINKTPEERLNLFKKQLSNEEAVFLNSELEKAILKDKVANWVKANLDPNFMEAKITKAQLSSLRGFIDRNTNKDVKRITSIKPISEVAGMSKDERLDFIKKYIKEEDEAIKINNQIEDIVKAKEEVSQARLQAREDARLGMFINLGGKRFENTQQIERWMKNNIDGFVDEKLGLSLSSDEMNIFQELGENVASKRVLRDKNPNPETIREYGKALMEIGKYTDSIKEKINPIRSKGIITRGKAINASELDKFDKTKEYARLMGEVVLDLSTSVFRTFMATGELSFMGIQGALKMASKSYWKNAKKLFFKKLSTPEGYANLQADIIGNPLFKQAVKDDLTFTIFGRGVSKQEDNFASILVDKLYGIGEGKWYQGLGIGRAMQKVERAQSAFLTGLRFDEYVKMMESSKLLGKQVNTRGIAQQINDHTGGAYINPKLNYVLSKVLFSPRNTVAGLKSILPWRMLSSNPVVRKETIKNYFGLVGIMAGFTGLSALKDYAYGTKNTEYNPAGNKWGKIRIGGSYYDTTFGRGTIVRLAAKQALGYKKTSTTDTKTEFGKYYGSFTEETRGKMIFAFGRGKLAPHASLIVDLLFDAENAIGEKLTPKKVAQDKLVPMYFNAVMDASKDPAFEGNLERIKQTIFNLGTGFVAIAPEFFAGDEKWETDTSKEKKAFLQEKGLETVRKANFDYNMKRNEAYDKLKDDKEYQNMDNDERLKELVKIREDIKKEIFTQYEFTPPKPVRK